MQAYLIDPHTKTTEAIDYSGDWRDVKTLIDCQYFDVVTTPEGLSIYVDDEGLYKNGQAFFAWKGLPVPLAGKALVLGPVDEEGETHECPWPAVEVACHLVFAPLPVLIAYCEDM
jgi:hypothetical protein